MKSFVACVFLLALVSGALCARQRRQAPAEAAGGEAAPAENGPPADAPAENGPPADVPAETKVDGLQVAIDSLEAKPEPDTVKINILKSLQAFLNAEKEKGLAAAAPPAPAA